MMMHAWHGATNADLANRLEGSSSGVDLLGGARSQGNWWCELNERGWATVGGAMLLFSFQCWFQTGNGDDPHHC
jgi:hypothetical protein